MTIQEFAQKHRLYTKHDECNDVIVEGRQGQIYKWSENGDGYFGVMFMPAPTKAEPSGKWQPRKWGNFKRAAIAIGMTLLQNGDSEGCLAFDPENRAQIRLAIKIAGVRPKRRSSSSQLENLKLGRRFKRSLSS